MLLKNMLLKAKTMNNDLKYFNELLIINKVLVEAKLFN